MSSVSSYETESAATERPTVAAFQSIDPELPVRFVGFWTAVLMPFVLMSLLAVGVAQQSPELLGGLLAANVAGLVFGNDYKR
ncbi:hypothetical protein BRD19_02255 [Halobacteriales archaeon SW_7_65_23]|nr:MAG: hypothetical protein BRD19_02255 [Halobacteriales archaeon SW_7_65_23]